MIARIKKYISENAAVKRLKSVALAGLASLVAITAVPTGDAIVADIVSSKVKETIIVDPGHGGFDGGAESESGTAEKDINLAIGLELEKLLEKEGFRVIMTRKTDTALGESVSTAIRSRKTADLLARKKLIDKKEPLLTVSIHLNSFKEDRSVHGAQVFYPEGSEDEKVIEESRILAESIREAMMEGLDDGTDRAVLQKGDIKIMKNVMTPIVLVECGFLSNYEEAKNLENADYQRKIADSIKNGIIQYTHFK